MKNNFSKLDLLKDVSKAMGFQDNYFKTKYQNMVRFHLLDQEAFSQEEYVKVIFNAVSNGSLVRGMYPNRIDETKPFSVKNIYFSFRKKARTQKNLTTGEESDGTCHARNFLRNWEPMKQEAKLAGYENHIEDYFLEKEDPRMAQKRNSLAWHIVRLAKAYPETGFANFEEFVEWSVKHGYSEFTEFQQVLDGASGPNTCVWDYFSEASYQEFWTKTDQDRVAAYHENRDRFYTLMNNLKQHMKICDDFLNDWTLFKKECFSHGYTVADRRDSVIRHHVMCIDPAKPLGPGNFRIVVTGNMEGISVA